MAEIMRILQTIREQRGWTRYRLAAKSGVSYNTLKDAEEGNKSPTIETVEKICSALGVDLTVIKREADNDTETNL